MRTWLICAGIIVLGVLANQSAIHWRSNSADSDLFAYYGWCIADGARPYLDVWDNKPPGIWWANAAAIHLIGPGVQADLLLGSVALLVSLGAFVGAATSLYRRDLAVPAAIVGVLLLTDARFESGANRTETLVVACETAAVCAYFRWLRGKRMSWLAAAGLLAGTAPLFKQSGLAAATAITLHHFYMCWRAVTDRQYHPQHTRGLPSLCLFATLAVAPAAATIALASQGALSEAIFAVGRFNQAYFTIHDATWLNLGPALQTAAPALAPLAAATILAGWGLVWGLSRAWSSWRTASAHRSWNAELMLTVSDSTRTLDGAVAALLVWLALAAYLALVGPGRRGHHFMPLLAPLGLLTLYPLHLLAGTRGLLARLVARPSVAGLLVAYAVVLIAGSAGNLSELQRCWQTKPAWYALHHMTPTEEQMRAAEVLRRTAPRDMIYVWGWSPGTYRWACRRPASRYATVEKFGPLGAHARFIVDGAVADIMRNKPRIIFLSPRDYTGIVEQSPGEFGRWLQARYEKGPNIGGMYLLTYTATPGGKT